MNTDILTQVRDRYDAGDLPPADNIPCTCGAPRLDHTGASHGGAHPANGCRRYRANLVDELAVRAHTAREHGFADTMTAHNIAERAKAQPKKPGQVSVRPSDLGGCRRAIWYRETPPEGYTPAPSDQRAAWMGGIIHHRFAEIRAELYPWRMYEAALTLPGSDRPYRFDEYDPITRTLYEIKTAGTWRWDQVDQSGPEEKWLQQAMLYAKLLRAKHYPVDTVVLLVLARENGRDEQFVYDYDEAIAQTALDWITTVAMDIELGLLDSEPAGGRDETGPATSTMCARLCPARRHCWNMDEAEALGRSPENLTLLGLTPDDAEVEARISDLVAIRESRIQLEKDETRLRALLNGVNLREYGDYKPTTKPTKSTSWKQYQEQIEAYWNDPDRPIEPPKPPTSTGSSTTWGRISKSERDKRAKAREKALAAAEQALSASTPEPAETEPAETEPPTLHVVAEQVAPATSSAPLELPAAEAS